MSKQMTDTGTLLKDYATTGSEAAFGELVSRYLNLVYATAMRMVGGDAVLAQDVAQTVFIDLARNARKLPPDVMLGGWLHRHTCFVASKAVRAECRRRSRERQAVEMNSQTDHSEANLAQVAPLLDEAINKLAEQDRTAIILRFFEQRDLRGVGEVLGASENAAQKRVSRALEELRVLLKRQGVVLSAGALGALLTMESVAAPSGLALSISATALGAGASVAAPMTLAKLITMTKTNTAIAGLCIMGGLGASLLIQHQAQATIRKQRVAIQQQARQLLQEGEKYAASSGSNESLTSQPNSRDDLARLRREVESLQSQTNTLVALQKENRGLHEARKSPLQLVEDSKEHNILRLNYSQKWLLAFRGFAEDHDGQFPSSFEQAEPFLARSPVAETNLTSEQFEIVYYGTLSAITNPANSMLFREKHAWSDYSGQSWMRTYGFADGHSEIHKIRGVSSAAEAARADAEPDAWEKQHRAPSPPPPP
jgi:RNA polymerase sigma factor (sigma-70 family)